MSEDSRVVGGLKEETKRFMASGVTSQVQRCVKLEAAGIKQQSSRGD